MKDFINDCLLFKSTDAEIRIIGVVTWFCILILLILPFIPIYFF